MKFDRFLSASALLALLSLPVPSLSATWQAQWSPPTVLLTLPGKGIRKNPGLLLRGNELSMLHLDHRGRVAFRRNDRTQTLDDEAVKPGGGYFRLHDDGRRLYAVWWDKPRGGKRLYVRVSEDGGEMFSPLAVLNTGGGVLPDLDIATNGAGGVAVAYVDERIPGHQIYVNRSLDGGRTWLAEDIRLDNSPGPAATQSEPNAEGRRKRARTPLALVPKLTFEGENLLAIWLQRDFDGDKRYHRWVARTSDDGGQNWSPVVEVYGQDRRRMSEPTLLHHQGRSYVFGFERGQGLLAFVTSDSGRTWQSLGPAPGTPEFAGTAGNFNAVASGDNVLLAYTMFPEGQAKSRVELARVSAGAGAWDGVPRRLDRKEDDLSRAAYAKLAKLADGSVIAVWEDFRHLQPAIYMDYSADGGSTWLDEPRYLTEPGLYAARFPRLLVGNDRVLVTYQRIDGAKARWTRSLQYQTLPFGLGVPTVPAGRTLSPEEKRDRLQQRAEEFWTLRIEGKFDETWDYFDPVYRARRSKGRWVLGQGRFTYSEFTLGEPNFEEPFAKIPVTVSLILPQKVVGGTEEEAAKPRETTFTQQWAWFYNEWYMVPPPGVTGRSHLRY